VPFYRPGDDNATDEVVAQVLGPVEDAGEPGRLVVGPPAGMVAARVADLIDTGHGRGGAALAVADSRRLVPGETAVFCQPVVSAPVVVRRDGRVQAEGWLPEHVRLGILEEYLGRARSSASWPTRTRRPGLASGGGRCRCR
jgi:hypothetical protein